jgi:hypothetical protein
VISSSPLSTSGTQDTLRLRDAKLRGNNGTVGRSPVITKAIKVAWKSVKIAIEVLNGFVEEVERLEERIELLGSYSCLVSLWLM